MKTMNNFFFSTSFFLLCLSFWIFSCSSSPPKRSVHRQTSPISNKGISNKGISDKGISNKGVTPPAFNKATEERSIHRQTSPPIPNKETAADDAPSPSLASNKATKQKEIPLQASSDKGTISSTSNKATQKESTKREEEEEVHPFDQLWSSDLQPKNQDLTELEKKKLQTQLDHLKEKKQILFLPLIHYERGQLRKVAESIYRSSIKEIQEVYPFIVPNHDIYKMKVDFSSSKTNLHSSHPITHRTVTVLDSSLSSSSRFNNKPSLSSSPESYNEEGSLEKERQKEKKVFSNIWEQPPKPNESPTSLETETKAKAEAEVEAEIFFSHVSPDAGSFLSFLTENFFDHKKEEYQLKKLISLTQSISHKKIFNILQNLDAFVEVKIINWSLQLLREQKSNFFSSSQPAQLVTFCHLKIRLISAQSALVIWEDTKKIGIRHFSKHFLPSSREKALITNLPSTRRSLWEAFAKLLPPLITAVEKLSWNGRVALISENKIYINGGKISGLQIGDVLQIRENRSDVFDPETGAFLGKADGKIKGFIKVIRHFGENGSVAVIQSGSNFKKNDRVELY